MKLSKHKIARLLKNKVQSQKKLKINKNKHKSLTFRKRKHINLRTKTLRGGVKFDLTNIISQNSNPKKMAIKKKQIFRNR